MIETSKNGRPPAFETHCRSEVFARMQITNATDLSGGLVRLNYYQGELSEKRLARGKAIESSSCYTVFQWCLFSHSLHF